MKKVLEMFGGIKNKDYLCRKTIKNEQKDASAIFN